MNNPSVEQLENVISAYINSVYKEVLPTEEEFISLAEQVRKANAMLMPVTDSEFSEIILRLKQSVVIKMDVGVYINDSENGHQSWLPSRRADVDFFFWGRYKKYLEEVKHWNPRLTAGLGKVSDEILDLCGDPQEDHFAIKGLVLGDVQSGKTANYTAICNKAADTGYRIIIILAGMQENLRKQTQERLDAECTGRKSEYYDVSRTQNTIYLRLKYDEPSGTVVNVRKSMWIHPTEDRAISIREAARLQTFPDSFIFEGTKDKQYQQVGNAVPPILAKAIAQALADQLEAAEMDGDA